MHNKNIRAMLRENNMLPSKEESEEINQYVASLSTFEKFLFLVSRPVAVLNGEWSAWRFKMERLRREPAAVLNKIGVKDPEHIARAIAMVCGMNPMMDAKPIKEGGIFEYPTDPYRAYLCFQSLYPKLQYLPYSTPAGALACMGIKASAIEQAVSFSIGLAEILRDPRANLGKARTMEGSFTGTGHTLFLHHQYMMGGQNFGNREERAPKDGTGSMIGLWLLDQLRITMRIIGSITWPEHAAIARIVSEVFNSNEFPKVGLYTEPAGISYLSMRDGKSPEVRIVIGDIASHPFMLTDKLSERVRYGVMQQAAKAA